MAVFLTTAMIGLISDPSKSWASLLPSLVIGMTTGVLVGAAMGFSPGDSSTPCGSNSRGSIPSSE
jgi:NhaP-type Na+/H+ and K+/H+ antiporter